MDPADARNSLDDIRRNQDRTREEYLRRGLSRTGWAVSALGLFLVFASLDLQGTWKNVVYLAGVVLVVGLALAGRARRSVHRRPGGAETAFCLGVSVVILAAFVALKIAARHAGLPAPATLAATAVLVAGIAAFPGFRSAYTAIVRRG